MIPTRRRHKRNSGKTMRQRQQPNVVNVAKESKESIAIFLLEMLVMVKLAHWKTASFATHKATDELYTSLNANIDKFIEVLLGKTGTRLNMHGHKTMALNQPDSHAQLIHQMTRFKTFLIGLNMREKDTDLMNIRDEILGNVNQFLYLMTFN